MAAKTLPSAQLLRQLLTYDPQTGELHWKRRPRELFTSDRICNAWNTRWSGEPALYSVGTNGHLFGSIFYEKMRAHRVIWAMQTGNWPPEEIDHIDHCVSNNRWSNLRLASHATNGKNYSLSKRNKSGVTGVCWNKQKSKWGARIKTPDSYKHLGLFDDFSDAVAARKSAELRYGYHPHHGMGRSIVGMSASELAAVAA